MRRVESNFIYSEGKPQDHCGVFAVLGPDNAPQLVYQGLLAINHRGQDSAGIGVNDGSNSNLYIGTGRVPQALDEHFLRSLRAPIAAGHVRYGTSGGSGHEQPIRKTLKNGRDLYFSHNGNLTSIRRTGRFIEEYGYSTSGMNDSEMGATAVAVFMNQGANEVDAVYEASKHFDGAYVFQLMVDDRVTLIKDRFGNKPAGFAELEDGFLFSSESYGSDQIGGVNWRELGPGQSITMDHNGLHSPVQLFEPNRKFHTFELIYFMRNESRMDGQLIGDFRIESGRQLAREHPSDADYVTPVVESGKYSGIGYHIESGIPLLYAIKKRDGAGRTFIAPEQEEREHLVDEKFITQYEHEFRGKKLVTVDDSMVRGTTQPRANRLLLRAGAAALDNRLSSPPVTHKDYYGNMNIDDNSDLIANRMRGEELNTYLGVESHGYLSLEGLRKVISNLFGTNPNEYNYAFANGDYPIPIEELMESDAKELVLALS